MTPQKVYIIHPVGRKATPDSTDRPRDGATLGSGSGTSARRRKRRRADETPNTTAANWTAALRAYILGPLALILWPRGTYPVAWAVGGGAALAAAVYLCAGWASLFERFGQFERGATIWMIVTACVIMSLATAWARAVAISPRSTRWPEALRHPAAVSALGLVLPGLGQLVAGRRLKAALAVWCGGLFLSGAVIAVHWRWVARTASGGGAAHPSVEAALGAAAVCAAIGFFSWIAWALDGVRGVSQSARSARTADGLSLVLLGTIVLFFATLRPATTARDLHWAAYDLRSEGLTYIPLMFYEAASALDPATPEYPARAAALYDRLGMGRRADAKRDLLESRAERFARATGADLIYCVAPLPAQRETDGRSAGVHPRRAR